MKVTRIEVAAYIDAQGTEGATVYEIAEYLGCHASDLAEPVGQLLAKKEIVQTGLSRQHTSAGWAVLLFTPRHRAPSSSPAPVSGEWGITIDVDVLSQRTNQPVEFYERPGDGIKRGTLSTFGPDHLVIDYTVEKKRRGKAPLHLPKRAVVDPQKARWA